MTTYAKSKSLHEQIKEAEGPEVRLSYRCAANGCPNAASIDDRGASNPGKCFFHWRAAPNEWNEVTRQIRADESMRNHGIVPTKPSTWVQEARSKVRGESGMRYGSGGQDQTMYAEAQ